MSIDASTVARIAHLARLKVPEEEQRQVASELSRILDWVAQLDRVDVANVAALTSVNDVPLPLREDVVTDGDCHEQILSNAPSRTADFFTVPKVVE